MPESPNPAQIAPGEEVNGTPIDEPYTGPTPAEYRGQSLHQEFAIGAQSGRY